MNENPWKQQYNGNGHQPAENNGTRHAGGMLHEYQQPPSRNGDPRGRQEAPPSQPQGPPSYSPLPPQQWNPAQQQGWVANTMQVVRRWSGRMAALPNPVDQQPLVRYRPGTSQPLEKTKPWKRSRTVRISMQMRRRRERWQHNHPSQTKIWAGVMIAFCFLIVALASSGGFSAYAYYQSQLPRVQGLANSQIDQISRIYDRHNNLLYDTYDNAKGRRILIHYDDIPQVMKDAMIAAEDHTFWDNSGVDPQGILRSAGAYFGSGTVQGGGSTITQQLIKNLTHDDQVSLNRKLPEAALAIGLTQQYSKAKILEMYLNVSPFGSQDLGVEATTEEYFHLTPQCDQSFHCTPGIHFLDINAKGKHDPVLALARASLLAGMPQNPVVFDPTLQQKNDSGVYYYLGRQDEVLHEMKDLNMKVDGLGQINDDIISQAEALTAKMIFNRYTHIYSCCAHFVEWVIAQVEVSLGGGDTQLGVHIFLNGGFNIRTTIDADLEAYAEAAVKRHLTQPEYQVFPYGVTATLNSPEYNVNDAAVVVMDAKTGEVLAMDGSSDYNNTKDPKVSGYFNATTGARQPGSSFKPIVYATAFQMGWYPGIVLPDVKTYFPKGGPQDNIETNAYHPSDYGGQNHYNGLRSPIRQAIANSFNVPAVKALKYAGVKNVVDMARRLGITGIDDFVNSKCSNATGDLNQKLQECIGAAPSIALGTIEVPLIQMVGAYQVFANQGVRIPPQGVLDIWDNYGHHLYHFDPAHPQGVQVLSQQLAYMVTSILSDEPARAFEFAGDHDLSFYDWDTTYQEHQVAAKTGTTDDFRDNWTIGYTPDVVVGVWAGNANNESFGQQVVGITGAAPIWHSIIERVSGRCNVDVDNVPCGKYQSPYKQGVFTVPTTGMHQGCVSTINGLMIPGGKGSGCIYDWLLDGEDPQQTGLAPATRPASGSPTP